MKIYWPYIITNEFTTNFTTHYTKGEKMSEKFDLRVLNELDEVLQTSELKVIFEIHKYINEEIDKTRKIINGLYQKSKDSQETILQYNISLLELLRFSKKKILQHYSRFKIYDATMKEVYNLVTYSYTINKNGTYYLVSTDENTIYVGNFGKAKEQAEAEFYTIMRTKPLGETEFGEAYMVSLKIPLTNETIQSHKWETRRNQNEGYIYSNYQPIYRIEPGFEHEAYHIAVEKKRGSRWSAEETELLKKLFKYISSYEKIGIILGRTTKAVEYKLVNLGLVENTWPDFMRRKKWKHRYGI